MEGTDKSGENALQGMTTRFSACSHVEGLHEYREFRGKRAAESSVRRTPVLVSRSLLLVAPNETFLLRRLFLRFVMSSQTPSL